MKSFVRRSNDLKQLPFFECFGSRLALGFHIDTKSMISRNFRQKVCKKCVNFKISVDSSNGFIVPKARRNENRGTGFFLFFAYLIVGAIFVRGS